MSQIDEVSILIKSELDNSWHTIEDDIDYISRGRTIQLAADVNSAKTALDEINVKLKEAKKAWDAEWIQKFGTEAILAQKKVITLNRALNNFIRTGDENLSMLWALFASVTDRIDATVNTLAKINKNTEGIEYLKQKAWELKKQFESWQVSMQAYKKGLEQIGQEAKKIAENVKNGSWAIGKLNGVLSKFGLNLGSILGFTGFTAIGGAVLNLGDKLEQANISFEVMLGSSEKAKKMLADLSNFAANTPFELQGIRDSAKQLMAMGIEADDMIPTMKMLGDISAGTGTPLKQIAYAFWQVKTAGVATTQDMNQLLNAGIPIWKELGKVVGATAGQVKKMVENREITFEQLQQAMKNMTEQGGIFNDLMSKQAESLSGKWSNFVDSLTALWEKIGTFLIPVFKKLIDILNGAINIFTSLPWIITLWVAWLGTLVVVAWSAISALWGLFTALTAARIAIVTFVDSIPVIGWIIAWISLIAWAVTGIYSSAKKSAEHYKEMSLASRSLADKLKDEKKAREDLRKEYEKWNITLEEYQKKAEESANTISTLTNEINRLTNAQKTFDERSKNIDNLSKNNNIDGLKDLKVTIKADLEVDTKGLADAKIKLQSAQKELEAYNIINETFGIINEEAKQKIEEKITSLQNEIQQYQNAVDWENKNIKAIDQSIQRYGNLDSTYKNLDNTRITLEKWQEKLLADYEQAKITVDEYNEKLAENKKQYGENQIALEDYKKGLVLVQDEQVSYADKIAMMNELKLSDTAYNSLLVKLKEVQEETLTALKMKALLLEQKIPAGIEKWAQILKNVAQTVNKTKITGFLTSALNVIPGGEKIKNTMWNLWQKGVENTKKAVAKALSPELAKTYALIDEAEKIIKDTEDRMKDIKIKSKKSGWWRGKSEEAKKAKKDEEDLKKARTNAYNDALKQSDKWKKIITDTNTKLKEQKKKLEEIRKTADEALKDIEEKILNNKNSYHEKLAKRYEEIIKEVAENVGVNDRYSGFAGYSNERIAKAIDDWHIWVWEKLKKELDLIKKAMSDEELKLALKKEERSETEKITEEYEKQQKILENSAKMNEALKAGRYQKNKETGEFEFYDEKGNTIKGINRNQQKEFDTQAKKIAELADNETKIYADKITQMRAILEDFDTQRKTLDTEYYNADKELKKQQLDMTEKYFEQQVEAMEKVNSEMERMFDIMNNYKPTQTVENEKLAKTTADALTKRKDNNTKILQEYSSDMSNIEQSMTNAVETETQRRFRLYEEERQRLQQLIALRMQAGFVDAMTRATQNVSNTTNVTHSPNISVVANNTTRVSAQDIADHAIRAYNHYQKGVRSS